MTKKREIKLTVKKSWNAISQKLIEQYSSQHEVKKSFKTNATVSLYTFYSICFGMNVQKAVRKESFGINYRALQKWSMMGNQFYSFFKFLLDKRIILRWQSEKINPKTNRAYSVWSHKDGVNSQYRINPAIINVLVDDEDITLNLFISQKNSFFFSTGQSYQNKLKQWRYKDDYKDYREPNEYQIKVMNRLKNLTGRINPTFVHGRIYSNDWTNLSKEERKLVKYNEKQIDEVFDIHNCFIQLLANKLNESGKIDQNELKMFSQLAYSGKFYQYIVKDSVYSRDDIKQKVMHFIFSNNWTKRHTIANQKKFVDGVATKRFDQNYIKQWELVKHVFKQNFPSIFSYMTEYEEVQIEGRKKSKLSVDLQWMENKYMLNGLMKNLQQKGLIKEPISLHDAIYLTKEQVTTEIKELIEEQWLKLVGHNKLPRKRVKTKANSEKDVLRNWLVETNTSKAQMKWFEEDKDMYGLFKIAQEYGTGKIKSTRNI